MEINIEDFFKKTYLQTTLKKCSEKDFNSIVINHRNLYKLEYDGANAQNFLIDGVIEARRKR